ncbi:cyclin-like protein [Stemphylium lycopersici]|uniref:Cyclin-like protein n=1 Tax=Stemphylium lycopersici TaxID=183478 RepID=A0A364N4J2_STELY|nr:cyclin-like protein [Stemphylium lycopersici]RAR02052.1 cyclin-like protein [Stemphylium lycopersici]RAR11797.1 cyclin-like protein [Stemphylium lycopersici]
MDFSPALSINSDMTDEELDKYFASCVPLSNLPTPPPAKEPTPARASTPASQTSPASTPSHYTSISPEQEVYATHLANLVPLNVSTHRPHASVIQGFLSRAELSDDIVAFAACLLDALSSRFATTWRDALAPSDHARDVKDFLRTDSRQSARVSPDVIVLASLSLAHGFLIDRIRSSRHWSIKESNGAFTVQEIEATKRAMLQDMDYGLSRISNGMVQRRLKNMQRAQASPALATTPTQNITKQDRRRNLSISLQGTAMWHFGVQTPEPSP